MIDINEIKKVDEMDESKLKLELIMAMTKINQLKQVIRKLQEHEPFSKYSYEEQYYPKPLIYSSDELIQMYGID